MTDRDDFLAWVQPTPCRAELALHNGDAAPRRALWSRNDPVSVLGAWCNAHGQEEVAELFTALGKSFSNCTSYVFELQAYDVIGDMAYTAGLEHTSASVEGEPRTYTLRATQVYRREDGEWKVAHRHGDTVTERRARSAADSVFWQNWRYPDGDPQPNVQSTVTFLRAVSRTASS
jgi:ketosteroid isomerase-like protein